MTLHFRPRRSCLYMPGINTRALEKGKTLPADVLILDLEDSVAPEVKDQARSNIERAISARDFGHREVLVRINNLDTEWGRNDLSMAVDAAADGLLAPKVTSGTDVHQLDAAMSDAGAPTDMGLWVMIEMPMAILNIGDIAAAAKSTRLCGLIMGTNDLAKETGAQFTADRAAFQTALGLTLNAARAYGIAAIDSVYNDINNDSGLMAECRQGRMLGFDGKTLIHPGHLAITNQVFSPDPEQIVWAQELITAFALPENQGQGVIKVNGKMAELLHLQQARRLVAIDKAIRAFSA